MKQSIMYSTMAVLGTVTIGSISAFTIFYNKYKDNDQALKGLNINDKFIEITIYPDDEVTHKYTKIYEVSKDKETLQDFFIEHSSEFTLGTGNTFLKGVNGRIADQSKNEFWSIESSTYTYHRPSSLNNFDTYSQKNGSLNIGIAGIHLTFGEHFNLRLSHF